LGQSLRNIFNINALRLTFSVFSGKLLFNDKKRTEREVEMKEEDSKQKLEW